jgi:hypothetical protein
VEKLKAFDGTTTVESMPELIEAIEARRRCLSASSS